MVPPAGLSLLARSALDRQWIHAGCELVDHGLVDGDPMGSAEILAYEIPDRRDCDVCHRWCPLFGLLIIGIFRRAAKKAMTILLNGDRNIE